MPLLCVPIFFLGGGICVCCFRNILIGSEYGVCWDWLWGVWSECWTNGLSDCPNQTIHSLHVQYVLYAFNTFNIHSLHYLHMFTIRAPYVWYVPFARKWASWMRKLLQFVLNFKKCIARFEAVPLNWSCSSSGAESI